MLTNIGERDAPSVLIVDGDKPLPRSAHALERAGFVVARVSSLESARNLERSFDLAIFPIGKQWAEAADELVAVGRVRRCVFISGGKSIDLIAGLLFAVHSPEQNGQDD